MREEEKFEIIWDNAQRMPEMERIVFYELERKKLVVGLLLAISFFGGGGLIYSGKTAKGALLLLVNGLLLAGFLSLQGFGPLTTGETFVGASVFLIPLILAIYVYSMVETKRAIDKYNKRLYLMVFDRRPP
ncbi:MAG: conserved membrane protein of unknown function [Methanothrix sp.]|jgi:hypothetical protein|nr:MAG: conserved membrane protein of unknown function [Methanothrix sp.]